MTETAKLGLACKHCADCRRQTAEAVTAMQAWQDLALAHPLVAEMLAVLIEAEEDLDDVPGREAPASLAAVRAIIAKAKPA